MSVKYKNLATKIFERGLKKNAIAKKLNITPRALNNKIAGLTPFTWEQVCLIQEIYFPDLTKDELFKSPNYIVNRKNNEERAESNYKN